MSYRSFRLTLLALLVSPAAAAEPVPTPAEATEPEALPVEPAVEHAPEAAALPEPVPELAASEPPADYVAINGGYWLNYTHNLFDKSDRDKVGDFGPGNSMFRVGFDTQLKGIIGSVRLRWYSYARVWEYGWVGYRWTDGPRESQLEVGLTKVPFGVLPYASYDYWFNIPYYVGLNNQYDVGIKWSGDVLPKRLNVQAGFFKNADIAAANDLARFAYDVVTVTGNPAAQNEETNQLNARVAATLGPAELGASLQYGGLYNHDTGKTGRQYAAAVHATAAFHNVSVQLQAMQYRYSPVNAPGVPRDVVVIGAFADAFPIAASARLLEANIGYEIKLGKIVDTVKCYNNYSVLLKEAAAFADSHMNVVGCSVLAGPVFGFVDLISAKNAPYIGTPTDVAFTTGGADGEWHSSFNVNLGFYFKTAPLELAK